jgi:hypothetical protein
VTDPTPPAAPARFDPSIAAVFAIGIGVPVALGLAWLGPIFALFGGVGAMNALFADPRRGAITRLASIAVAMAALLAVAGIGSELRGEPAIAVALTVAIAFGAGFVPMAFPYLSIVARLLALAMIAVATTVMPAGHVLGGYLAGALFATLVALAQGALRGVEPYADPLLELKRLREGDRNELSYAVAYAGAVALALAGAYVAEAPRPFWAALAALFVMHPDRGQATQRIGKRIGGTFAGVGAAWLVVVGQPDLWVVVAAAIASAALMPYAMRRDVFAGTFAGTLFVLLLLDIGLAAQGGDRPLIVARLLDTLIGTAAVAIATIVLDRWRHPRLSAEASDGDTGAPPRE